MGIPNVEDVVRAYVTLRDKKNERKREHAEELRPLTEKMEKLENWLMRDLQTRKVESEKTKAGTAFMSTVSSATVQDRDAFFEFVIKEKMWDLLENRVSKSVVKDRLEETGELVPGVNYNVTKVVRIRR